MNNKPLEYNKGLSDNISIVVNNPREKAIEILAANGLTVSQAEILIDKLNGAKNEDNRN